MKRIPILIIIVLMLVGGALGTTVQAQGNDKIQAMKIAFFTEKLDLSSSEAASFWPVYKEYNRKKMAIKTKCNGGMECELEKKKLLLDLDTEYFARFKEILPAQKVDKIPSAEREFKRRLLEEKRKRELGR